MPDENKLTVFAEAKVRIAETCATCTFATFRSPVASWGECGKHKYQHARQDPTPRPLPAHVTFVCASYKEADNLPVLRDLGTYADLLRRE